MPVKWYGNKVKTKITAGAMAGLLRGAEIIHMEMLRLILTTPKTGRIYRSRGRTHRASAPGEPPASDTGRLVNSLIVIPEPSNMRVIIKAGVEYAAHLEYGTERMMPRPFARPALANTLQEVAGHVAASVRFKLDEE